MTRTALLTLCVALGLAAGAEAAPERPAAGEATALPLPPPRPDELGGGVGSGGGGAGGGSGGDAGAPTETTAPIPLPPPRPNDPAPLVAPASVVEDTEGAVELQGCLDRLATLGVQVEPMPPIAEGACGAKHPVRLTRLPGGVGVSTPAVVTCPVAEALAQWSKEVLAVESNRAFGTAPLALQIGNSYQCRGQNRQALAKLSEHAFANAVDVMGFTFPKRPPVPVTFHPEGSPEGVFFKAVRAGACAHFTTVLGPGSDSFHADHLHLDLRGRRGAHRMCQ